MPAMILDDTILTRPVYLRHRLRGHLDPRAYDVTGDHRRRLDPEFEAVE